eukprot:953115-Rhodomonas_salina.2
MFSELGYGATVFKALARSAGAKTFASIGVFVLLLLYVRRPFLFFLTHSIKQVIYFVAALSSFAQLQQHGSLIAGDTALQVLDAWKWKSSFLQWFRRFSLAVSVFAAFMNLVSYLHSLKYPPPTHPAEKARAEHLWIPSFRRAGLEHPYSAMVSSVRVHPGQHPVLFPAHLKR